MHNDKSAIIAPFTYPKVEDNAAYYWQHRVLYRPSWLQGVIFRSGLASIASIHAYSKTKAVYIFLSRLIFCHLCHLQDCTFAPHFKPSQHSCPGNPPHFHCATPNILNLNLGLWPVWQGNILALVLGCNGYILSVSHIPNHTYKVHQCEWGIGES